MAKPEYHVKSSKKIKRDEFLAVFRNTRITDRRSTPRLKNKNIFDKLFINEHPTSFNKILLNKTKKVAKI